MTQFSRETFSSALELGRKPLISLGGMQAHRAQQHFRRLHMRMLRELAPNLSDSAQVSRVREARRELEDIFFQLLPARDAAGEVTAQWLGR